MTDDVFQDGADAYDAGHGLDAGQAQEWQDGWLSATYASGMSAAEDDRPLEEAQHPVWIQGWRNTAGGQAHAEGLPLDDDAHPDWRAGWQQGAHTDGWHAGLDGLPYDPDAPDGWRAGWTDAYGLPCDDADRQTPWMDGFRDGIRQPGAMRMPAVRDRLWQAGWRQAQGVLAGRAGVPLDDEQHPDWQTGWRAFRTLRDAQADIWALADADHPVHQA